MPIAATSTPVTTAAAPAPVATAEPGDSYPHPALPAPSAWPGAMVIICIIWILGTAALLGPIVRMLMTPTPHETPPLDEPAALDGH